MHILRKQGQDNTIRLLVQSIHVSAWMYAISMKSENTGPGRYKYRIIEYKLTTRLAWNGPSSAFSVPKVLFCSTGKGPINRLADWLAEVLFVAFENPRHCVCQPRYHGEIM